MKLDDDSDEEEEEGKEGQENAHSASNHTPAVPAPCAAAEEKKPQLSQEELEAKQGISVTLQTEWKIRSFRQTAELACE